MRKPPAKPTEQECPACKGTGYPVVVQPARPGRKIYPPLCNKCGGRGRITEAANRGGLRYNFGQDLGIA
jgi:DnaJ-class molecular chaperone